MAVLGPRFCARAFSSCGKRGPLLITVHGPPTIAAPPVAEHRLQTRRLSNCGSRAQPLRGMWDPPRPGPEPASPALAGRISTTAPPGRPLKAFKFHQVPFVYFWFDFHYSRRWIKKILLKFMSQFVLPMFSSKSFIVSSLTFSSLLHMSLFLCMVLDNVLVSFFYMQLSSFSSTSSY